MKQFKSRWHKTIDTIDKGVWNDMFRHEMMKSYELFASMEKASISGAKFYFLEISDSKNTVALLPCFRYKLDIAILSPKVIKGLVKRIRSIFPRFMVLKIFGIGSLAATCEQHIGINKNLSKGEVNMLGDFINQQVKIMSKILKCPLVLIKEVPANEMTFVKSLFFKDFHFYDSLPNTFIPVNGLFSPYPAALKRNERKRFRKSIVKFESDFEWEIVTDFSMYSDVFEKQYLNVLNKSKNKFETMNKAFFDNVNEQLQEKSFLLISRDSEKKIRSTELVIEEKDKLIPMYLGLDYAACTKQEVKLIYFNTIFRTIIEAEKRNKEMVVLGQTSYYPKIMSGALVQRLFVGFYSYNKFLQYFISKWLGLLFQKTSVLDNTYKKELQGELKKRYANVENI